jgi:hypothetical protein
MSWPPVVLWLLIIFATFSRGPLILYLFSISVIFGGLSMVPAGIVGLNLPAQTTCGAILIAKIFLASDNLAVSLRHAVDVRKLGLLGLFIGYFVITSLIYPRLFAGDVLLYTLNAAESLLPLQPTSANFTQTVYLIVSVTMVFAFATAARSEKFRTLYLRSIALAGAALIGSGLIDMAFSRVGATDLLDPFHNATYHLLDTVSIGGLHRVVGFMPEASVFGSVSCTLLGFFVFNVGAFEPRLRRRIIPFLILGLTVMTLLSTSSTGYVGLIVTAAVFLGRIFYGVVLIPIRSASRLRQAATIGAALTVLLGLLAVFGPFLLVKYHNLLDAVLFQKTTSSSYLERSRWTQAGVNAFFATHGIGVGVGSIRTSNWFVNILASTGIVGVLLFFGFLIKMLWPSTLYRNAADRRFANGLKLSVLPTAAMIWISGTTPDPGVWAMSLFGLIYGLSLKTLPDAAVEPPLRHPYENAAIGDAGLANP